ncbi:hypothetical protein C8Q76DRAFT_85968 [Earliella scabrosa]|nr:hypothetical protein C8Q76DRAFT_85968 [Earliella scabrosa]
MNPSIPAVTLRQLYVPIALDRYAPQDAPVEVNIYEGDTEVRTVGAGITIWPRTWAVMRHLGLAEDLARVTVQSSETVQSEGQDTDYSRSG